MLAAYIASLALVGLTPLLLFFDSLLLDGLVELYVAVALAMLAFSIRPGETAHWFKTIRWAAALAALPVLWMIIQLLPLPIGALSGSIWQSAASALGVSMWSSITIDPGLTVLTLCRYASMIGIAAVAAAVSTNREQAEWLFLTLGGSAVALSIIWLILHLMGLQIADQNGVRAAAAAESSYGVIFATGIIILLIERHMTRRATHDLRRHLLVPLAGAVTALMICALAAATAGSEHAIFAAACGLATVLIVQFVRRIGLDWRAAVALAGVAVVAAVMIIATKAQPALADFSMRYVARASTDVMLVADRMVHEVGFGGSGAGTFNAIFPLYASGGAAPGGISAPTSASQIAIELGRPMLWVIVTCFVIVISLCARGGFNRGRDFFYPLTGAGVGVSTLVMAFCDVGLNNPAVAILLASTLGLALAQSASRSR